MAAKPYIPESVRQRVREHFGFRCSYCLASQRYVLGKLEVEHIIAFSLGGSNEEWNLCLACRLCNVFKNDRVEAVDPVGGEIVTLYNPRTQIWSDNFRWSQDGTRIIGVTPVGRATVKAMQLNHEIAVEVRRNWVKVGWHPPETAQ